MRKKCPRCGNIVETGNARPGTPITCTCGNVLTVPKRFPVWLIFLIAGGVACVPCTGVLAAIAIPNFIRFQSRAKQAECKANLKSFYVASRSAAVEAAEGEPPSLDLSAIGFSPERGNRYAYFVSFDGPLEDRSAASATTPEGVGAIGVDTFKFAGQGVTGDQVRNVAAVEPGIVGTCPECGVAMVCAGNLDNDETLDVWSIATVGRTLPDGTAVSAGEPFQHVDDLTQ